MDEKVIDLIKGFFGYFGFYYIELDVKSIKNCQMDDMVWFTISKKTLRKSAREVIKYYERSMEIEKEYKLGQHFPFRDCITKITYTDDESIGSSTRRTIHLWINENEYFKHWVYWNCQCNDCTFADLIGQPLIAAVDKILSRVYDD